MKFLRRLFGLPDFKDEQDQLTADWLLFTLLSLLLIFVLIVLDILVLPANFPFYLWTIVLSSIALVPSYLLLRRGQVRPASIVLIAFLLIAVTYTNVMNGGESRPGIVVYNVFVLIAGLLLGSWGALMTALVMAVQFIVIILARENGLLSATTAPPPVGASIVILAVGYLLNGIIFSLAANAINDLLRKLRNELAQRQQSEERYRRAIEAVGAVPYVRDDLTKSYTFMGEGIYHMLGYTPEEMSPALMNSIIEENHMVGELADVSVLEAIRLMREGKIQMWRSDSRLRTHNGEQRWVNDRSVQIYDAHHKLIGAIGALQDVTDRKLIEEQLRASLHEKEVLIKEVHHRVKNNLQVIVSILNLQAAAVTDPTLLSILRDSQNRVRAMALVHEKLYQSKDLAQIDFHDYLQHLASTLFHSYSPYTSQIDLTIEVDPVALNVEAAIPCGLLVSELLTNVLKHAFPNNQPGQVAIRLRQNENGQLALTIEDNGVGFPADKDWRQTESLGMQLVQSLVKQLHGTMELTRLTPGARFTIQFPG